MSPDVTDLARLDEEMAPLQARLDELHNEYNRVLDQVNEQTLAALDLTDVRARTGEALLKLPGTLAGLEEVLTLYDEVSDWAYATFPDADEPWQRLRDDSGLQRLEDALEVVASRLNNIVDREAKEGDGDRARVALDEIVGRAGKSALPGP